MRNGVFIAYLTKFQWLTNNSNMINISNKIFIPIHFIHAIRKRLDLLIVDESFVVALATWNMETVVRSSVNLVVIINDVISGERKGKTKKFNEFFLLLLCFVNYLLLLLLLFLNIQETPWVCRSAPTLLLYVTYRNGIVAIFVVVVVAHCFSIFSEFTTLNPFIYLHGMVTTDYSTTST